MSGSLQVNIQHRDTENTEEHRGFFSKKNENFPFFFAFCNKKNGIFAKILYYMDIMPTISANTDLKDNYNEMNIETYELLSGKLQLYSFIEEGLNQVKQGKIKPMKAVIKSVREKIN